MSEATAAAQPPETATPKEIGAQMAKLREQFNLSQQEVSERLHIRPRYVSAIEEGRYELMPGKVYARGYVHTYAEFLGLDAEKIVAQCFAGEAPANAQPIPAIAAARYTTPAARASISHGRGSQWRGYGVLGAIVLVLVLVVYQFTGRGGDAPKQEETTVAPVPEAMLASMRNMVMPLPNNYECLSDDDALLACFNSDDTTHLLGHLDEEGFHYGGPIDVSSLALAPAEVKEATASPEEEPTANDMPPEDNPDSPPVMTIPAEAEEDTSPNSTPPHD